MRLASASQTFEQGVVGRGGVANATEVTRRVAASLSRAGGAFIAPHGGVVGVGARRRARCRRFDFCSFARAARRLGRRLALQKREPARRVARRFELRVDQTDLRRIARHEAALLLFAVLRVSRRGGRCWRLSSARVTRGHIARDFGDCVPRIAATRGDTNDAEQQPRTRAAAATSRATAPPPTVRRLQRHAGQR